MVAAGVPARRLVVVAVPKRLAPGRAAWGRLPARAVPTSDLASCAPFSHGKTVTILTPPSARWCSCATYDSRRDRLVLLGGRGPRGPVAPETWTLDLATRAWTRATTAQSPRGVIGCSLAYAPGRDAVYLFGGADATATFDETWRFDPEPGAWTRLSPASRPSSRYDAEFRYVPERASIVLFSGGARGEFPSDLWSFDPATEAWSAIAVDGPAPPGRRTPWLRVEPGGAALVAGYGTTTLQGSEPLSDLWRFDFATSRWEDITPPLDTVPDPRGFTLSLPAGAGHIRLMVGGYDGRAPLTEVWRIDPPAGDTRW